MLERITILDDSCHTACYQTRVVLLVTSSHQPSLSSEKLNTSYTITLWNEQIKNNIQ